jgi:hypothetical protein
LVGKNGQERSMTGDAADKPKDGTLEAECERLRRRVQQLEAECGGYHRALTALLRERCALTDTTSDAELDRLAEEALRLGDFESELRELLRER